ncbi:hypothetical protein BC829DRAFT_269186 [Chytridium lagenaria]|nr:hypothetical protein BC829DRAFT_269186 [Chytridium lagenaria]
MSVRVMRRGGRSRSVSPAKMRREIPKSVFRGLPTGMRRRTVNSDEGGKSPTSPVATWTRGRQQKTVATWTKREASRSQLNQVLGVTDVDTRTLGSPSSSTSQSKSSPHSPATLTTTVTPLTSTSQFSAFHTDDANTLYNPARSPHVSPTVRRPSQSSVTSDSSWDAGMEPPTSSSIGNGFHFLQIKHHEFQGK